MQQQRQQQQQQQSEKYFLIRAGIKKQFTKQIEYFVNLGGISDKTGVNHKCHPKNFERANILSIAGLRGKKR